MISSALFANGIHIFGRHKKDDSPQGIYCANGQCAQCLVIADGVAVKSCITPVKEGMDVKSLSGIPELPADDKLAKTSGKTSVIKTQVLIVGGGPAGLSALIELVKRKIKCIICDDKHMLGGKLTLQTHNFFGSIRDCYAGSRGIDIGRMLSKRIEKEKTVQVWLNSPVVGVFSDKIVGILKNDDYKLVKPEVLLITTGAREKPLAFPGCDLPGVYGAGAFQTLVNRDLIKPTKKLFIIGGGNVGLIAAYHALQAGIDVLGIAEAMPNVGGYKVHLDKIKRLGVPVFTSHTILRAEGKGHLERVIISKVNEKFKPMKGTEIIFDADTLLIAVGLTPVDELKSQAEKFGLKTYSAGDSDVISEASAAMISGKIVAYKILQNLGYNIEIPPEWNELIKIFGSKTGPEKGLLSLPKNKELYPVIRCLQEIPCNPCVEACNLESIEIKDKTLMGLPKFKGDCVGCCKCVVICPGLAITIVDKRYDKTKKTAKVIISWEMPEGTIKIGKKVITSGFNGESIGQGKVIDIRKHRWQNKRSLVHLEVPYNEADLVAGIIIRNPVQTLKRPFVKKIDDEEIVICRCERVTKKQIKDYIIKTGTRDINAIKASLRVGMGPCDGKTCTDLIIGVFRELGIDKKEITPPTKRPFTQEIPIKAFIKGKDKK
jgi:NADPH-dependent 2,4-dienoyl-CoA reductase/sulfur reductase-like enzyme/ferredoxin